MEPNRLTSILREPHFSFRVRKEAERIVATLELAGCRLRDSARERRVPGGGESDRLREDGCPWRHQAVQRFLDLVRTSAEQL